MMKDAIAKGAMWMVLFKLADRSLGLVSVVLLARANYPTGGMTSGVTLAASADRHRSRTLMKSSSKPAPQTDLTLLVSLYAAEFALVLIGLALHKLGERPLAAWPPSNPSLAFLAGAGLLIVALAWIGRVYLKRAGPDSRGFGFTVAMNLITLALVLTPVEVALRLLSRDGADAPIFGGTYSASTKLGQGRSALSPTARQGRG